MPYMEVGRNARRKIVCRAIAMSVVGLLLIPCGTANSAEPADGKSPKHPLVPALEHARAALGAVEKTKDYQAVFSKRERINGRLGETQTMQVKIRRKPLSIYLRFTNPHEGREVIYVDGQNNGNLLAHGTGIESIAGTLELNPTSERAMAESRFPITMMGLRTLVGGVILQWEQEAQFAECNVKYYPEAKLGQTECYVIESTHPRPRKQFKFHMTRLYIEKKTRLPVRVEQYGFPTRAGEAPPLMEEYTYANVRADTGLNARDFDPRNPNYEFPN